MEEDDDLAADKRMTTGKEKECWQYVTRCGLPGESFTALASTPYTHSYKQQFLTLPIVTTHRERSWHSTCHCKPIGSGPGIDRGEDMLA